MRCSLLVVAVLSCAAPTAAQDTLDTVRLRNGGIVRGTVLEYEPGGDVVIRSFTGEDRRIPAAEVAEVRIGGDIVPVRPDAAAELQPTHTGDFLDFLSRLDMHPRPR